MHDSKTGLPASFYTAVTVVGVIVGTLLAMLLFIANRWGAGGGDLLQALATLVAVVAASLIASRELRHSARLTIQDRRYAEYVDAAASLEVALREHETFIRSWLLDFVRRVDLAREIGARSSGTTPWNPIAAWNVPGWLAERVEWERAEHKSRYVFRSHMEKWLLIDGPESLREKITNHDTCARTLVEDAEVIFSDAALEKYLLMPDRKDMTREMAQAAQTLRQPLIDSLNTIRHDLKRHVKVQRETLGTLAQ